jgi:hypothetical protein
MPQEAPHVLPPHVTLGRWSQNFYCKHTSFFFILSFFQIWIEELHQGNKKYISYAAQLTIWFIPIVDNKKNPR